MRRPGSKPVRNAAICRRYAAGEPIAGIAHDYGISTQRVEQIARAGAVPVRQRNLRPSGGSGSLKSPPNGLAKPIPFILATDCVMLPVFPIRLVSVPAACRQGTPSGE